MPVLLDLKRCWLNIGYPQKSSNYSESCQFTDPSAFSLFTQKMIFWVMNQVHSYLQLPALWCFFVTTVLPFLPYGAVGATSSLEQMAGQLSGKSEIDSHLWQMVKRAGKEEIKEILSHDSMFK